MLNKNKFCAIWCAITAGTAGIPLLLNGLFLSPLIILVAGFGIGWFLLPKFIDDPVGETLPTISWIKAPIALLICVGLSLLCFFLISFLTSGSLQPQTLVDQLTRYMDPLGLGVATIPLSVFSGILMQGHWRLQMIDGSQDQEERNGG